MTTETRKVWVAYTNTDLTEGRGQDVAIAMCELEATAMRLAKKAYVQGCDGPVRSVELLHNEGRWYAPMSAVSLTPPTNDDRRVQTEMDRRASALAKAKAAGLTDEDLKAISNIE